MATPTLTSLRRTAHRAMEVESRAFSRRRPVDRRVVFFESFDGNGALCNPEAIFRTLVKDPGFADFRFIWSLRPGHDHDLVLTEFGGDARVRFVEPGSKAYARAVSTAGYLVTNSTFPRWFSRRDGQVVLNTWHGTPLKKMGFDIDDQPARVANVLRTFLHSDYLLSSGDYMTDTLYRRAHRLDGLFDGRVLQLGLPRVDAQFADAGEREETIAALRDAGLDLDGRRLVLFAPTWKGTSFVRPDDPRILVDQARDLQDLLGDDYRVALKAHQVVHDSVSERAGTGLLVPNDLPTNRVLAVTDHLVTDYSSVFFDFLTTGRPLHFFVPDIGDYGDYRGLYLEPSTWPGRVTTTLAELAESVRASLEEAGVERLAAARRRFAGDDDGRATARVVDAVFRGVVDPDRSRALNESTARRVLLVAGGPTDRWDPAVVDREIATIDLDTTDLTVLVSDSRKREFIAWQKSLDRRIRVVVRQGGLEGSKFWSLAARVTGRRPPSQWRAELQRLFGLSRFDAVVVATRHPFWVALGETAKADLRPGSARS